MLPQQNIDEELGNGEIGDKGANNLGDEQSRNRPLMPHAVAQFGSFFYAGIFFTSVKAAPNYRGYTILQYIEGQRRYDERPWQNKFFGKRWLTADVLLKKPNQRDRGKCDLTVYIARFSRIRIKSLTIVF
jgi:hypothetical protein